MKMFSLLRAALSQDMNLFNYKTKNNSKKRDKILLPIFLFILLSFSMGIYAFQIGQLLEKMDMTYILLTIFFVIITVLTFIEGIYKSQSILFDSKDNDLLFSLPIRRGQILFVRIFKMILYEYMFNMMFLLLVVYIILEKPSVSFYFLYILYSFLIPIIPTVISSVIGYLVKTISSRFKSKKILQTLLTGSVFMVIFILSFNMNGLINKLVENATSINDLATRLYFPIGGFISIINKFDIMIFIKLLLVNIIPLIIFIIIGQTFYFKIISNTKNYSHNKNQKIKKYRIRKPLYALVIKELKRYFSSVVYMFNTVFGLLILIVFSFILVTKGEELVGQMLFQNPNINISIYTFYYFIVIFSLAMTSISSSSISLEKKSFNITKTLPISAKDILKSKIIFCFVIEVPFIIASLAFLVIFSNPSVLFLLEASIISILIILFNAVIGLLLNLKYPKLDAQTDTEVIKQSMSATISVFVGMGYAILSIILVSFLSVKTNNDIAYLIHIFVTLIISLLLYYKLIKNADKSIMNINVS